MILRTHSSWVANGPEKRLPSSSAAYQPGLMPRMYDRSSLMYWGMVIVALPVCDLSAKLLAAARHSASLHRACLARGGAQQAACVREPGGCPMAAAPNAPQSFIVPADSTGAAALLRERGPR